jgi:hypothetical protein
VGSVKDRAQGGPPLKPGSVGTEGGSAWIDCSCQVTAKDPSLRDADEGVATVSARIDGLRDAAGPRTTARASCRSSSAVADQPGPLMVPVCPCAVAVALENVIADGSRVQPAQLELTDTVALTETGSRSAPAPTALQLSANSTD